MMFKRVLILALALCLVISFAGCGGATKKVDRPDNWDLEAEVLRHCNGIMRGKTVEEIRPYVESKVSDASLKAYMDANNASMEQMMADSALDYRDYPYDSVEVTLVDTYKNYEIIWAKLSSSAYNKAIEELDPSDAPVSYVGIGPVMLIVTIENGHYVATIDEDLLNEVQAMYGYCDKCHGEGCWGTLSCNTCYGIGMWSREVCPVCNEEVIFDDTYYGTIDPNGIRDPLYSVTINPDFEDDSDMPTDGFRVIESIQGMLGAGSTCPNCGESVSAFITITEPCTDCQGEALTVPCDACDGKGWIKK